MKAFEARRGPFDEQPVIECGRALAREARGSRIKLSKPQLRIRRACASAPLEHHVVRRFGADRPQRVKKVRRVVNELARFQLQRLLLFFA
jgi:hypothetical protein